MKRRPLFWQLFPVYLLVLLAALAVSDWFTISSFKSHYLAQTARELEARAVLLRERISLLNLAVSPPEIDRLCKTLGRESGTRVTVMLAAGTVIGDTEEDPSKMENHANRPEVQAALAGQTGSSTRYSHTLHRTMMYTAVPLEVGGRLVGIVRAALPIADINETFGSIYLKVIGGLVLIGLLAAAVSVYLARRISKPLVTMTVAAERFTQGDFQHPLPSTPVSELNTLASTMNDMAAQLDQKIRSITNQRNERDAVLTSMVDGVIAVDSSERIITVNRAASGLLDISGETSIGHYLQEIVRVSELHQLVDKLLRTRAAHESRIELGGEAARIVTAIGAPFINERGENIGAVVVLHDITQLHRLEIVRRDFVANVSHELRTPITSIKGFVETVREGGIDTEQTRRFLDIISRQTDRLNSIINDLLSLSQLEQSGRSELGFEPTNLDSLVKGAFDLVRRRADAARLTLQLNVDPHLTATVNPSLMEQALVNLLDNAIKYSNPGGSIEVEAGHRNGQVTIAVIDHGCGIEQIHLPRLFERFYRVDRARSRELGGTGLGLSIVKHITTVHGGTVSVQTAPGTGSVFTITIPATADELR